jgi:hypothetical protein
LFFDSRKIFEPLAEVPVGGMEKLHGVIDEELKLLMDIGY